MCPLHAWWCVQPGLATAGQWCANPYRVYITPTRAVCVERVCVGGMCRDRCIGVVRGVGVCGGGQEGVAWLVRVCKVGVLRCMVGRKGCIVVLTGWD